MARYTAYEIADALGIPAPTDEQRAVIEEPLRPLLVVAGAGSGKTETMASRVVYLVANQLVLPDQVLGLTFTRKAAGQLAERIGGRLRRLRSAGLWEPPADDDGTPSLADIPTVQTYHSYAGRLVSEHGLRVGVEPDARLLTEAAAWQIAQEAVTRYDGPMEDVRRAESTVVAAVMALSGEMAEHLLLPDEVDSLLAEVISALEQTPPAGRIKVLGSDLAKVVLDLKARRAILPIVQDYANRKHAQSSLDFADQMALAARLAQRFPLVGATERRRFKAVLLDEFQDTSEAQLVLLRSLFVTAGSPCPVTAVGDPHQSIYGWRGASATTLAKFAQEFLDADGPPRVLPLSTSWRNDEAILTTANHTAAPLRADSAVPVAQLQARPGAGPGSVIAIREQTIEEEADAVASWIADRWQPNELGRMPSAAVLCRKRSLFTPVVDALGRKDIPVEIVGVGGLLMTPEVSDLVSLLWVVQDPTRGDRLMRLLTGPIIRCGAADLDALAAWSRQEQPHHGARVDLDRASGETASIVEAVESLPPADWVGRQGERLSPAAATRLAGLGRIIARLRAATGLPLAELALEAERALGLDIEVAARPGHTPQSARVHLDAFADVAAHFSVSADRPTLGGFLAWLDAAEAEERGLERGELESSADAVQVLTVHAAKGLEWDFVAVPGLVEGTFPAHGTIARWDDELLDWLFGSADGENRSGWTTSERAWLGGIDAVPFDLRGDSPGLPQFGWAEAADIPDLRERYATFIEQAGAHSLAEERRLAYVAFTRARRELLLTSAAWGDGKMPRFPSRFVAELVDAGLVSPQRWVAMPQAVDGAAPVNPRTVEAETASWPDDPLQHRRIQLADAFEAVLDNLDFAPVPVEAAPTDAFGRRVEELFRLLAERAARRLVEPPSVTLPRHLSASAVVALADDPDRFARRLRRPMPAAPALAARQGTRFHAWVEQFYASAALVDVTELPGSADEDADLDADLEAMKHIFLASPWASRTPVDIEVPLETWIGGLSIRGRIDAVFERDGGGYVIVDWKTGKPPTGRAEQVRAVQLAAYRIAYARLRQVPVDQVDAVFYDAQTGQTRRPQLPTQADIEQLLALPGP